MATVLEEHSAKISELEASFGNEKKVLKSQISELEESLGLKEAELVESNQGLTMAKGEIESLRKETDKVERAKSEAEEALESLQEKNGRAESELAGHRKGWEALSGLLAKEEGKSKPPAINAHELYEALGKPSTFNEAKCIGWWDGEPWLNGVRRALLHLHREEGPDQLSRGEERLKLVLNMNINSVLPGTPARRDFEASFVRDLASSLGCKPDRIHIGSISAGSVVVAFSIAPGGAGEASPASLKKKLAAMVLDRRSDLYNGGVTCMVDEQRSARALTGMGVGELEAVSEAIRAPFTAWAQINTDHTEDASSGLETSGLSLGREHVERCASVLSGCSREYCTVLKDLAMGEVLLKGVCEMYRRASSERDSSDTKLRATVQRAAGRAVLTWVERMGRDAMRYQYGLWRNLIKSREVEELRAQKKYSEQRIEEENEKRAKLKKQALKVQQDNKAMQEEKQQRKMEEEKMLAATGRSLILQSMSQVEGYFTTARGFFMEEGNAGYEQFKRGHKF